MRVAVETGSVMPVGLMPPGTWFRPERLHPWSPEPKQLCRRGTLTQGRVSFVWHETPGSEGVSHKTFSLYSYAEREVIEVIDDAETDADDDYP